MEVKLQYERFSYCSSMKVENMRKCLEEFCRCKPED